MARPKKKNTVVAKPVVKNPPKPKKDKLPFNFFNIWSFAHVYLVKQLETSKDKLEIITSKYEGVHGFSVIKKRGKYLQE